MVDHLTEQLLKKDKKAYRELIMLIQRPLYAFLYPILKNKEMVDDVMQNTFLKVYKKIDQFSKQSSLKTWIFTIAKNECFSQIKKSDDFKKQRIDEKLISISENPMDDHILFKTDLAMAIEEGMELLSPVQKKVFHFRRIKGFSTKETSEEMNCSEAHVKKQLYLAMERIRLFFKKNYSVSEKWYMREGL